jgi:hypothetical protein
MRLGQIQNAIDRGVTPFELCRLVSTKIRTTHKHGDHIQDSIGAVFSKLGQNTGTAYLGFIQHPAKQPSAPLRPQPVAMHAVAMKTDTMQAEEAA